MDVLGTESRIMDIEGSSTPSRGDKFFQRNHYMTGELHKGFVKPIPIWTYDLLLLQSQLVGSCS